jgi:hypothetical protein
MYRKIRYCSFFVKSFFLSKQAWQKFVSLVVKKSAVLDTVFNQTIFILINFLTNNMTNSFLKNNSYYTKNIIIIMKYILIVSLICLCCSRGLNNYSS